MNFLYIFILCSISYISLGTELKTTINKQSKTTSIKKSIPQEWITLKAELKNRNSSLTSPIIQKRLKRIYKSMQQKNSEKKSIELINTLEKIVQNRPFELTKLYYLKAQIYSSQDNLKKSFLFYDKAISLKRLSYKEHLAVLYDQARLYFFKKNIKKASELTEQLLYLDDNHTASIYVLKASLLIEKKQHKQALKLIVKAINSTKNPKQGLLHLGAMLYLQTKQYVPAAKLLKQLTAFYPNNKKYWKQLSSVYLYIKKEDKALATLDLAYKLKFLNTQHEILNLVGLLIYQGLYFKAAHLMETSMFLKKIKLSKRNYEILGDCWIRSSETKKALKVYLKAAKLSKDGKIFAKLGRLYLQNKNWNKSVNNLKLAIKKGNLKNPAQIYIWIGSALVNLKKYKEAIKYFEKVVILKTKIHYIKTARYWINYTVKRMSTT